MSQEVPALTRFIENRKPPLIVRLEIDPRHVLRALQDSFARLYRGRRGPVKGEEANNGPNDQGGVDARPSQRSLGIESIARRVAAQLGSAHDGLRATDASNRRRLGHADQQESRARSRRLERRQGRPSLWRSHKPPFPPPPPPRRCRERRGRG